VSIQRTRIKIKLENKMKKVDKRRRRLKSTLSIQNYDWTGIGVNEWIILIKRFSI
jgi:hypothetical protein